MVVYRLYDVLRSCIKKGKEESMEKEQEEEEEEKKKSEEKEQEQEEEEEKSKEKEEEESEEKEKEESEEKEKEESSLGTSTSSPPYPGSLLFIYHIATHCTTVVGLFCRTGQVWGDRACVIVGGSIVVYYSVQYTPLIESL